MYKRRRYSRGRRRRTYYFPRGYARIGGAYGRFSMNSEKKYKDFAGSTEVSDDTWTLISNGNVSLVNVDAGTGPDQRIGEKIYVHSLHAHIVFEMDKTSTTLQVNGNALVRLLLVQDMQANGSQAPATQPMQTTGFTCFRDLNETSRFKILLDKVYTLPANSVNESGTGAYSYKTHKNVWINKVFKKPIVVNYSGTTGGISEVRSNNLFWIAQSEHDGTAGNYLYMISTTRIRFTD